jgi:hypothetical protein
VSVARRPLIPATAAGTLLCALWFVPSATAAQQTGQERLLLAETGGVDTTPYVVGGTACLAVGAGFVAYSVRRRTPGTV